MGESESKANVDPRNHWRSLAELLGTAPPEEPESVEPGREAADALMTEAAPAEPAAPPREPKPVRTPPARRPSDWYALACQLGLEVEPPPPPVPIETETTPPVHETVSVEPLTEDDTAAFDDVRETQECEGDAELPEIVEEVVYDFETETVEAVDFLDEPDELARGEAASEVVALGDEEDESQESESVLKRRRRRRRRRPRDVADSDESVESETAAVVESEADELDVELAEPLEDAEGEAEGGAVEESFEEAPRRRRPRRRRRRPGRDAEGAAEATGERAERDEDADAEDSDLEGDLDSDLEDDERGGQRRSKHKKIPTWEETISVIVAANMESRGKNGNSRGKSRGSRRRRG